MCEPLWSKSGQPCPTGRAGIGDVTIPMTMDWYQSVSVFYSYVPVVVGVLFLMMALLVRETRQTVHNVTFEYFLNLLHHCVPVPDSWLCVCYFGHHPQWGIVEASRPRISTWWLVSKKLWDAIFTCSFVHRSVVRGHCKWNLNRIQNQQWHRNTKFVEVNCVPNHRSICDTR